MPFPDTEEPPLRRRRPALSCIQCRSRKLKCDRVEPACSRCLSSKTQCSYRISEKAHTVRQRLEVTSFGLPLTPRADGVSTPDLTTAIRPERPVIRPGNHHIEIQTPLLQSRIPGSHRQDHVSAESSGSETAKETVQRPEGPSVISPTLGLTQTGRAILASQAGLRKSDILLKKTRILRWSDWMGTAPEFKTIFDVVRKDNLSAVHQSEEVKSMAAEMEDLLLKCKRIAKSLKTNRPSRSLLSSKPRLDPPSREIADEMATLYFRHFESAHRILHVPSFWANYERFWDSLESATTGQRLNILLVIGIGASLHAETGPDTELRTMIYQWVYTAQAWLAGPLEKDRLDLAGLQVHCLAILARQIFSVGGDLVWMSMGSLVHAAMQIGLHRDPKHLPPMSLLQAEIRRRLWYTIVEMVAQTALDAAMPPRMSFDDFDTEVPSNINDEDIDESTTALHPHSKEAYTSTSLQLLLIESLSDRLQVVQKLSGLHAELYFSDVLTFSSRLTTACRAVNNFYGKESRLTTFHRNLYDFLILRFTIPLHAPFACEARTNPVFSFSQTAALDAALNIITPEPDAHFERLMAVGGGMFREAQRCANAIVTMQLLARVEEQRRDGTLRRNTQHVSLLRQATETLATQSWERVRLGETNIKSPVFLAMILAFAENPDAGERKMAECAQDSLVLCHNLLRGRADALSLPSPNDGSLASGSFGDELDGFGMDFSFDFLFPGPSGNCGNE
ncbi:hypothetical protein F5Y16DRAFT_19883 [Xylariaceae sp. FL0255]|nr:hypothetical protein F5Y16DRAFT_19883 [Xylariaceae sp. FL0255]